MRRVGFEGSDSDNTEVSHTAESDQSEAESEEVLDSADPPSTSGRGNLFVDDVPQRTDNLLLLGSTDMAGLSLTKLAKRG